MKIYIAHPFLGKQKNKRKVEKIILKLIKIYPDYLFVSPIHCTGFYYFKKPYEEGMKDCYKLLEMCDQVWLFGEWYNSRGCRLELDYAGRHGIPAIVKGAV